MTRGRDEGLAPTAPGEERTYAGLDVSLKETAICIVDEVGKIVWERMVATNQRVVATSLVKHAPGLERVGLKSGATSAWLWRELRGRELPAVCLDSRHAHRVLSMKRNKNDRNDARGLADLVRIGDASGRSMPSSSARCCSRGSSSCRRAAPSRTRCVASLKTLGAMTGSTKGRRFLPRVIALRAEQDWLGPVLDPLLATHAAIAKQLKAVTDSILRAAREDADVRRLMTVPGIGAMTALAFKAAIDDPEALHLVGEGRPLPRVDAAAAPVRGRANGSAASAGPTIPCCAATFTRRPAC